MLVVGVAVAAAWPGGSGASRRVAPLWLVNDQVDAVVVSGHTLYMGGRFTQIAPHTGPLLAFSASSGAPAAAFPRVADGAVYAIVSDGQGGWFVGGQFGGIGGVPCANLAHVTAAMTVAADFCPRPNGAVDSLALDGSTLYIGGFFTRAGGVSRRNLAALDAATGRTSSWGPPAVDGAVRGIALRNGILYLLGYFSTVGGKKRFSLAAVEVATSKVTGWDPQAPGDQHGDTTTNSIAAGPTAVFVGGRFDEIGGRKRDGLAALDPTSGKATSFVPTGQPTIVSALAVADGRLYAGGVTDSGGYLAAYDASTGNALSWRPQVDPGAVNAITVGGSTVYTGGKHLQAFDVATGQQAAWAPPPPNKSVATLALSGSTVAVGGAFMAAGGVMRDGLAALDLRTGRPTNWYPRASSHGQEAEIDAIALSGSTVYVGGDFDRLGGKPRTAVGAVDAASGKVTTWAPKIGTGQLVGVAALVVSGSNVYLGGFRFTRSEDSFGIAASYDTSGKRRWSTQLSDSFGVQAIAVTGGTVYAGGDFTVIRGKTRNGLAAIDARNGSVRPLQPGLSQSSTEPTVYSLAVSGSTLYVGGDFDRIGTHGPYSVGGQPRPPLAALNTTSGTWTAWTPKLPDNDLVSAIAATPSAVYTATFHMGARAFNPKTGMTLPWHPKLKIGDDAFSSVHTITVAGSTVYIGDDAGLETASRWGLQAPPA